MCANHCGRTDYHRPIIGWCWTSSLETMKCIVVWHSGWHMQKKKVITTQANYNQRTINLILHCMPYWSAFYQHQHQACMFVIGVCARECARIFVWHRTDHGSCYYVVCLLLLLCIFHNYCDIWSWNEIVLLRPVNRKVITIHWIIVTL